MWTLSGAGSRRNSITFSAIGPRHVWVAHGRDYADVAPLKGIFTGGGESTLDVAVHLTRLG